MNWLGAGLRTLLAAMLGCLAGAIVFIVLRRHGLDLVPIVGLLAGVATASVSRVRSPPRGFVVGALALWTGAIAEVLAWPKKGFFADVIDFHERLGWLRLAAYAVGAVLAIVIGARAYRSDRQDVVR